MESDNKNDEVFLKILDLEITRKQKSYIFLYSVTFGTNIGVIAAIN